MPKVFLPGESSRECACAMAAGAEMAARGEAAQWRRLHARSMMPSPAPSLTSTSTLCLTLNSINRRSSTFIYHTQHADLPRRRKLGILTAKLLDSPDYAGSDRSVAGGFYRLRRLPPPVMIPEFAMMPFYRPMPPHVIGPAGSVPMPATSIPRFGVSPRFTTGRDRRDAENFAARSGD